jgi:hypothetical protein
LGELVTKVLKGKLGFIAPSVMMASCFLYEEGEGADEDLVANLDLILTACPAGGICDGKVICVEDFNQKLEVSDGCSNLYLSQLGLSLCWLF